MVFINVFINTQCEPSMVWHAPLVILIGGLRDVNHRDLTKA